MDMEVLFHSIMTDPKGSSKSNIAARFQNAFSVQVPPPIGVFWDIENCQVPKGKSAIALVQNIREKFFENHREAEFMCVCDIHKESKVVIQELLFAQVTVVHISATSKNAADDKLKQCMKRFVDTHGSPATLLLISDDVNFASDLSDFRHRHSIRIILIHRGHAHQSLLTCAHEHHNFFTITQNLPTRSPPKADSFRPCELDILGLPIHRKERHIKNYLQKLSSNCGGKVVCVRGSRAIVRFASADIAEKAKKRMDKEIVFGNKISVNLRTRTAIESSFSPCRDYIPEFNSTPDSSSVTPSPISSRDSSPSPPPSLKLTNYMCNSASSAKFDFPPPPIIDDRNPPALLLRGGGNKLQNSIDNSRSFGQRKNNNPTSGMGLNNLKAFNDKDSSAFSPFRKEKELMQKKFHPFLAQEEMKNIPRHLSDYSARRPSFSTYQSTGFLFHQGVAERINESNGSIWGAEAAVSRFGLPLEMATPVELHVSNLDPKFEVNEMKKILLNVFSEHVMVIHISMSLQPDGSAKATVKVPSLQDAQYAISRLHRRQVGHKRILISYVYTEKSPPFHVLKSETVSLLNDIPAKNLPLIKFRELYEKRYHRPIAVSELYRMRDAVLIQGDSGSRMVYLNMDYCKTPSLIDSDDSQEFAAIERPYCERHFHVSDSQGWAEQYSICPLPMVCISLKVLSPAVHMLLDSHMGSLPLISFCDCYEAEIGPIPVISCVKSTSSPDEEGASDPETSKPQKGVPLEHLIACIAGVEVANSALCIKKVQWMENRIADSELLQNCSPALASQLKQFGVEVLELLKSQSGCLVSFSKFIPTYHHHFGRQCRVADYGFTKLIDLLEAIPHIVQVLGEGQNRQVTLTHRTQVKRFSAELLRVLKSRASKQVTVPEFPQVYEQVVEKPFDITNYGVCEIEDMLDEVPESVIGIMKTGSEIIIGIPKREQTPEEIERTKLFSSEVIKLMKHTPHCTMSFNKFIPAYHHHFGKQCRVADYGFTKLIELFEAIPDVLEVTGTGEEKVLQLVTKEQHKILADRLISVIKSQPNECIELNHIGSVYAQIHGHALRPLDFGFPNVLDLVEGLDSTLRMFRGYGRQYVTLIDSTVANQISRNMCRLLMETKDCCMSLKNLSRLHLSLHGQQICAYTIHSMMNLIQVKGDMISLTPLLMLARDLILLLQDHEGQLLLSHMPGFFFQKFGVLLSTSDYGFTNMQALLESLPDYFVIKGKRQKRLVCLHFGNIRGRLPDFGTSHASSRVIQNPQNTSACGCLPSESLPCHKPIQFQFVKKEPLVEDSIHAKNQVPLPLNCPPNESSARFDLFSSSDEHSSEQVQNPAVIKTFDKPKASSEQPKSFRGFTLPAQSISNNGKDVSQENPNEGRRNRLAARFNVPFI